MVPVELRLSNFLSYGAETQCLDFQSFHVACLSGRNGQGKSALLDAMTWALWGEARKSSGSHKPDEELLRIGAHRMRVELVFDVEGVRYRVLRGYARSASGKTSKPELELHLLGEGGEHDQGKPLTRASIRETQEVLDQLLGLDYSTFINSAFLLQGRSDEFTKKRPNERKDILARILNLDTYERLSLAARDQERVYSDQCDRESQTVSRLSRAMEEEAGCRQDQEELLAQIDEGMTLLSAATAAEAESARRLDEYEHRVRESASLREALERLVHEETHLVQNAAGLDRQLAEADALLLRANEIETAHQHLQTLQHEFEALYEKREHHRAEERKVDQLSAKLRDATGALEMTLHALDVERKRLQDSRHEMTEQLGERSALDTRIAEARLASSTLDQRLADTERRSRLQTDIHRLEQALVGLREALIGEQRQLARQFAQRKTLELERQVWMTTRARLAKELAAKAAVDAALEALATEGQTQNEALTQKKGTIEALEAEIARLTARLNALEAAEEGECPTCGQPLTASHRETATARYLRDKTALETESEEAGRWVTQQQDRIEATRARYRQVRQQQMALTAVAERFAGVEAEGKSLTQRMEEFDPIEDRLVEVARTVERHAFGEAERHALDQLLEERDAIVVDEKALNEARAHRVRLQQFEERRRFLDQLERRYEEAGRQIVEAEEKQRAARQDLEPGGRLALQRAAIELLQGNLEAIGFDPMRFDRVQQEIKTLAPAAQGYRDLEAARTQRPAWDEQRSRLGNRLTRIQEERALLVDRLEMVRAKEGDKVALQRDAVEKRRHREGVALRLRELDVRRGELNARLEQFGRDREALERAKAGLQEAERERGLYRHLRTVFGKNGIPSLIIEETLPEIERRANELLDRLSDGRMHVRLETLKDKKTGGTRETLDIIITDEHGAARPYETFSGGEAFRVNFALRIALSQLLAERKGVRIRTLGIDEGFGTQDEQGIESMIDAIQTIKDDFDKILVITHLDRLKEAFPVRIEVEKHPVLGSQFQVLGV
ncbi:MAG: SMC family ATPase [Rhodothermales bacterium]|nr:SMC family ATPase [Rhodothermales bacterium]